MIWTADFDVITPLFGAGNDQNVPEIRLSSIKNEIVFWWRAITFQSYVADTREAAPYREALSRLQQDERLLFGDATRGQGLFVAALISNSCSKDKTDKSEAPGKKFAKNLFKDKNSGLAYMGYGLAERTNGTANRQYWDNACFTLKLRFKPTVTRDATTDELLTSLYRAIRMTGLVGAFGGRKRRGYGSLSLRAFEGCPYCDEFVPVVDASDFKQQISALAGSRDVSGRRWQLSAFAKETEIRIWNSGDFKSGQHALEEAGNEFRTYRSWKSSQERRASPLIFRIARVGKVYVPVAIFFDNLFLPNFENGTDGTLKIAGDRNAKYRYERQGILDFLDGSVRQGSAGSRGSARDAPFGERIA